MREAFLAGYCRRPPVMATSCGGGMAERNDAMNLPAIDPMTAAGVVFATAATDAVYVRFASAVAGHRRVSAANWSSLWYILSSYAVISYTDNWVYVVFAAIGSWIGAFVSLSFRRPGAPHAPIS